MKRCSKCGRDRKEGEFSRSSTTLDGLQAWCRFCKSACPPSPPIPHVPGAEKRCTKCGHFKSGLDFSWKKSGDLSYGLQSWCKECMTIHKKAHRRGKSSAIIAWDRQQRELVKQDKYEALKKLLPPTP